eukprot:9486314-Pyramimonas_sp.AAC.1
MSFQQVVYLAATARGVSMIRILVCVVLVGLSPFVSVSLPWPPAVGAWRGGDRLFPEPNC